MESSSTVPEWKLARHGIELVINNKTDEAEALFKQYPDSLQIYAGYSCALFMDALMTFEEDKLNLSLSCLHELERRCSLGLGTFKSFKTRLFGSTQNVSYVTSLETQIILADSQMCISILTLLQQDIAGYFKGAWILRKSWKLYQQLYKEILELYEKTIGKLHLPEPFVERSRTSSSSSSSSGATEDVPLPLFSGGTNGYTTQPFKIPRSRTANSFTGEGSPSLLNKSASVNNSLAKYARRRLSDSLSGNLTALSNFFASGSSEKRLEEIDSETIKRLMGAVSFGYGLFQLGISLLPPALLKVSSILGFSGDKGQGVECLMYARLGSDMRAPLATLALLWYHTIVRPFYALDGRNVQAGVEVSKQLLRESQELYHDAALFLFFSGRVHRLNSEIQEAMNDFLSSAENTAHREVKILSMHEVAWCYLIFLDFSEGEITFQYLKNASRWCKAFYAYMATICQGSCAAFKDLSFVREMGEFLTSGSKDIQLYEFLNRRFKLYPTNQDDPRFREAMYWKLLAYEILYLWNSLPSCTSDNLGKIITECAYVVENGVVEPMVGLAKLLEANCHCNLAHYEEGMACFRQCLDMRKRLPYNSDDAHVSAFAQYELGALLVRNPQMKEEGKALLQQVSQYRNYDFEQRLSVRIHSMLKHL